MRRWVAAAVVACIAIVIMAVVLSYLAAPTVEINARPNPLLNIAWHCAVDYARGFCVDDGKIFTINHYGSVTCYDAEDGEQLWHRGLGRYWQATPPRAIIAADGRVYAGNRGPVVNVLDWNNGTVLWQASAPLISRYSPDLLVVKDGRLFIYADGWAVCNATSGDYLWENKDQYDVDRIWPLEGNLVFISRLDSMPSLGWNVYRVDPDNGSIVWRFPGEIGGCVAGLQEQVILWNYNGSSLVGLNQSSGEMIWSYEAEAGVYEPTLYNDLLLFGTQNGDFYALNATDGGFVWKTHVDHPSTASNVDLLEGESEFSYLQTYPVEVDSQNARIFWGFKFTYGEEQYTGVTCSLSLSSGNSLWLAPANATGFALLNNTIYLTGDRDLYCLDESTGMLLGSQFYNNFNNPPIAMYGKVYVLEAQKLTAYAEPQG
jgi:outer membrane protein assembly factor BamB